MASNLSTPFKYQITIRRVIYGADTLKLLSEIYCRVRDASGEGNSTFRSVNVREGSKTIGHISYNGRVWDQPREVSGGIPCLDSSKLLYDNRVQVAAPC